LPAANLIRTAAGGPLARRWAAVWIEG